MPDHHRIPQCSCFHASRLSLCCMLRSRTDTTISDATRKTKSIRQYSVTQEFHISAVGTSVSEVERCPGSTFSAANNYHTFVIRNFEGGVLASWILSVSLSQQGGTRVATPSINRRKTRKDADSGHTWSTTQVMTQLSYLRTSL